MSDKLTLYTAAARKRIDAAVKRIERTPPPRAGALGAIFAEIADFRIGKTAAPIAKGASGTVNVYWGATKGSETWDGVATVTAYNRFASVASGKWVFCIFILGGWELIAAEC